ncbi:MAG: hypothetical protein QM749_03335 [Aquabacterium sp.]
MNLKPIAAACVVAAVGLSGCGGGNSDKQNGDTAKASGLSTSSYLLACVDTNQNWQCDDGDTTRIVSSTGDTGLTPAAGQYTLIENRDAQNRRVGLLISQKGSAVVNGISTLRTTLSLGTGSTLEQALLVKHGSQLSGMLENGYAATMSAHPVALNALAAYSAAVQSQSTAAPINVTTTTTIGAAVSTASWALPASDDGARQLGALGSTVVGSNESNRLYLFDPTASVVDTQQFDLIPAADNALAMQWRRPMNRWLAALDKMTSVFIDTASAASSVSGTPSAPVVMPPGKGIAGMTLTHGGQEALILMNTGNGRYTSDSCAASGSEGLFRVSLDRNDTSGFRLLAQSPACVHSGFSLVASDPSGARVLAWDASKRQLWSIDGTGTSMAARAVIALQTPATPTAMAVSPGGRYAVVAGSDASGGGQLAIIDLDNNYVVTTLTGDWTNPGQVAFAEGGRTLLISSGAKVITLTLSNTLQPAGVAVTTLSEEVRSLTVAPDGGSYVVAGDSTVTWRTLQDGTVLATAPLPAGLAVKRIAVAKNALVVLGLQASQASYKVFRLPMSLAQIPG